MTRNLVLRREEIDRTREINEVDKAEEYGWRVALLYHAQILVRIWRKD